MKAADVIGPAALAAGFRTAGERLRASSDELCRLDAAAGDGDLGTTLSIGFDHVSTMLDGLEAQTVGDVLRGVGRELARNAPSTLGTLLGTAFIRSGAVCADDSAADPAVLAKMLG